jgi:hypothetical protein
MLSVIRPVFEVVIEGRILNLVPGYRRVTLFPIVYDEKSSLVDKRFEISNRDIVLDMERIMRLEEDLSLIMKH